MPKNKKPEDLILRECKIEKRAVGNDRWLVGLIPFDSPSESMWGTTEVIRSSAFTKTIREMDVKALWNHNDDKVLGRKGNGTLELEELAAGLECRVKLPNTTAGNDAWESVSREDVVTMSFGFICIKDATTQLPDGKALRELLEVKLLEVSFGVPWPAYPATDSAAQIRAIKEKRGIDIPALAEILLKDDLAEDDREEITNSMEQLRACLGAGGTEPEGGQHGEPEGGPSTRSEDPPTQPKDEPIPFSLEALRARIAIV